MSARSMIVVLLVACVLPVLAGCSPSSEPSEPTAAPAGGGASSTLPSGLQIEHLQEGSGASPAASDTVTVHYEGTFPDGKVFDSSRHRGVPASFPLNRVIACWTEGLQRMKVGGRARLICPPQIAYGERGAPPRIPPNATLHFDVELISIP